MVVMGHVYYYCTRHMRVTDRAGMPSKDVLHGRQWKSYLLALYCSLESRPVVTSFTWDSGESDPHELMEPSICCQLLPEQISISFQNTHCHIAEAANPI